MNPKHVAYGLIATGFAMMEYGVWLYNRQLAKSIWDGAQKAPADGPSTLSE